MLADGTHQYLYDGEGRICAVASTPLPLMTLMTGYVYDADGTRVSKGRITAWSCDPSINGFQTTSDYVLGLGGEQVTEMGMDANDAMAWLHSNVWAGGTLIGTYDDDGLHLYIDDPLGTRRVQTDSAGVIEQSCPSLPYGDGEGCPPTPTENLFTGKERDAESGNDYFGARYYAIRWAGLCRPDWSAKSSPFRTRIWAIRSRLNLYAYVGNNPLYRCGLWMVTARQAKVVCNPEGRPPEMVWISSESFGPTADEQWRSLGRPITTKDHIIGVSRTRRRLPPVRINATNL